MKHFAGTVFSGTLFVVSLISSHVMSETSVMLAKCLQLNVAGFQRWSVLKGWQFSRFLRFQQRLLLFHFWFDFIFHHQIYIYIRSIYALLMISFYFCNHVENTWI